MILLFDIGNTHTHLGLANGRRVVKQAQIPTAFWFSDGAAREVKRFLGRARIQGSALCSVVPRATPHVRRWVKQEFDLTCFALTHDTVGSIGIRYPRPATIGPTMRT